MKEHCVGVFTGGWILVSVLLLTLLGSAALFLVAFKYYWGERGKPPPVGEARRLQKEAELKMRAKQIEYEEKNPVKPRNPNFWDNRKVR